MKATRHGDHLIKLTRQGWMNCYLVREDDGFTLVDTTMPGAARSIIEAAEEAGAPIARIAVTHAHGDHVGSVDALHAELPDVELLAPERDARFMRGDKSLDPGEPAKPRGGFPQVKTEPARLLNAGDRVGSLEVVASPGHTVGHVAFLDTRDRTLIAGDAFQTLGGLGVAGEIRPLFPLPGLGSWHKPTAIESGRALAALDPSRLAVGHGKVLESPRAEMERVLARASS